MTTSYKQMLKVGLRNGFAFTTLLLIISYFKNGMINYKWIPIWFLFFGATGALRYYYMNKKTKE